MSPAILRQRLLSRVAAEPAPGWVARRTLAREYRVPETQVEGHLQALREAGQLQGHSLRVFVRVTQ